MVAAESRYHKGCFPKFLKPEITNKVVGRPPIYDPAFMFAFGKLCDYLENNDTECQYNIKQLMGLLKSGHSDPDSIDIDERTLSKKLQLQYKDNLKVDAVNGKPTNFFYFVGKLTMNNHSRMERLDIVKSR